MRTIKFRAWDTREKAMHDWLSLSHWKLGEAFGEKRSKECQEFIFEQFTGLKDKNGKEIYEGDVVKRNGENWSVCWDFGSWNLGRNGQILGEDNDRRDPVEILWNRLEVIGTVHENPDLLV